MMLGLDCSSVVCPIVSLCSDFLGIVVVEMMRLPVVTTQELECSVTLLSNFLAEAQMLPSNLPLEVPVG
jgi:hypothetical protein